MVALGMPWQPQRLAKVLPKLQPLLPPKGPKEAIRGPAPVLLAHPPEHAPPRSYTLLTWT